MTTLESDQLDREIDVFCRYLIDGSPDEYVVSRYRQAHEMEALKLDECASRFDCFLVGMARISPVMTRLADTYASLFPAQRLRRKLVLALGILENSPEHFESMSAPPHSSRSAFVFKACGSIIAFAVNAGVGVVLLLPTRLACWLSDTERSSAS